MRHLLVTNDFPPKQGGIQSYLWELWRRLPPGDVTVLTTPHPDAVSFDAEQPFRVVRSRQPVMLPTPAVRRATLDLAAEVGAELVVLDPAVPLGHIGPSLGLPYAVVLHGAEVTLPGRAPGVRRSLAQILRGAAAVIAAGEYPADEGERAADRGLPVTVVPPGVDHRRFHPLGADERAATRRRFGLPADATLVLSVSRLVPRKGMDVLIRATAELAAGRPQLLTAIGGDGRDRRRLDRLVERTGAPVRMLGRVAEADLAALFGCADVFAMLCRNRWADLEQEGFGIVFLEAAACSVPAVAGSSGGASDAVVHGETGLVVDRPRDIEAVAPALAELVDDPERRRAMGEAGRRRAISDFDYDRLAAQLEVSLDEVGERGRSRVRSAPAPAPRT